MKEVFLYNERTHTIHIEGYCPYASRNLGYLVFKSEDDALARDGRAARMCKRCQKRREE